MMTLGSRTTIKIMYKKSKTVNNDFWKQVLLISLNTKLNYVRKCWKWRNFLVSWSSEITLEFCWSFEVLILCKESVKKWADFLKEERWNYVRNLLKALKCDSKIPLRHRGIPKSSRADMPDACISCSFLVW